MLTEQELNAAFSTLVTMLGGRTPVVVVVVDDEAVHTMSNLPSVADRVEVLQDATQCVMDADYQSVTPIVQPQQGA